MFSIVKNEIALTNNNDKYHFKRRIDPDSIKLFQNELSKNTWKEVLNSNDSEKSFTLFFNTFKELYSRSFPLKKLNSKERKLKENPWMTKAILKSSICKNKP